MRSTVCKIAILALLPLALLADWRQDMDGLCWSAPVASSGCTWSSISNLVSHWKMNDNASNATVDDNYGSNDGTARNNTSTITTNGKINSAIKQLTANDYISAGYSGIPWGNASPFSVSIWVKTVRTDSQLGIAGFGKPSQNYVGILMYQRKLQVTDSVNENLFGTTILDDDVWHHIVFTWAGSAGSAVVFVDGQRETVTGTYSDTTPNNITQHSIGSFQQNAGFGWTGGLDDYRIYSRALTTNEAQMLYFCGNGTEEE